MKKNRSFRSTALVCAALLGLPLAAGATPPPDDSKHVLICGGAYVVDLTLDFTDGGIDVDAVATADVNPTGFSPPPPAPSYAVYAGASYRYNANTPWDIQTQQFNGDSSYPAQPAAAIRGGWKSPTCQIGASAIASVSCPDGTWAYETLNQMWNGCGT